MLGNQNVKFYTDYDENKEIPKKWVWTNMSGPQRV